MSGRFHMYSIKRGEKILAEAERVLSHPNVSEVDFLRASYDAHKAKMEILQAQSEGFEWDAKDLWAEFRIDGPHTDASSDFEVVDVHTKKRWPKDYDPRDYENVEYPYDPFDDW